ncbi:hypothetical protein WA158_007085 [Blastocystis sp. Blastoise]
MNFSDNTQKESLLTFDVKTKTEIHNSNGLNTTFAPNVVFNQNMNSSADNGATSGFKNIEEGLNSNLISSSFELSTNQSDDQQIDNLDDDYVDPEFLKQVKQQIEDSIQHNTHPHSLNLSIDPSSKYIDQSKVHVSEGYPFPESYWKEMDYRCCDFTIDDLKLYLPNYRMICQVNSLETLMIIDTVFFFYVIDVIGNIYFYTLPTILFIISEVIVEFISILYLLFIHFPKEFNSQEMEKLINLHEQGIHNLKQYHLIAQTESELYYYNIKHHIDIQRKRSRSKSSVKRSSYKSNNSMDNFIQKNDINSIIV